MNILKKKYEKIAPNATSIDYSYQRPLDDARARAIAKKFDPNLVGVAVLSRRANGELVRIDGQHRFSGAIYAGHGDTPFLCEVYSDLTLEEEAELFLRLNGGRSAVASFDKFKARVTAGEQSALTIVDIAKRLGLRVAKNNYKSTVSCTDALDYVYRQGNLQTTLSTLVNWGTDAKHFDRTLIKGVSAFLLYFKKSDAMALTAKLVGCDPERVAARILQTKKSMEIGIDAAACIVLREIYNTRRKKDALPPVDLSKGTRLKRSA